MSVLRLMAIRGTAALLAAVTLPLLQVSAAGCSLTGCVNDGIELQPTFVVTVTHDDVPLSDVMIEITGTSQIGNAVRLSLKTSSDGNAQVAKLAPGQYWLNASFLGISAAYQCFHVLATGSEGAKGRLNFNWGDDAPGVRRMMGHLVYSAPGKGGTPIWNLVHRVNAPIAGVNLKLLNALTGLSYTARSDENGRFDFGDIPEGTYVLHVAAGKDGDHQYPDANFVLDVAASARFDQVLLTRANTGCGDGFALGFPTAGS